MRKTKSKIKVSEYSIIKNLKEENLIDKVPIIFSPVYKDLSYENLSEWILEDNLAVRFQVQLHKIIWGEKKGV